MEDVAARLKHLERTVRGLLVAVGVLLVGLIVLLLGWTPALRASTLYVERLVVRSEDGRGAAVDISARGVRLADPRSGGETWLAAPSSGDPTALQVSGPSSGVSIDPAGLRAWSESGALLEVVGGAFPRIVILGGPGGGGQTDVGPGFTSVKGAAGSTFVDARADGLGVRVVDVHGKVVGPR